MDIFEWIIVTVAIMIIVAIIVFSMLLAFQKQTDQSKTVPRNVNRPSFSTRQNTPPPTTSSSTPSIPPQLLECLICQQEQCTCVKNSCSRCQQELCTCVVNPLCSGRTMPKIWRISKNTNRIDPLPQGWISDSVKVNSIAYDPKTRTLYAHVTSGTERGIYMTNASDPESEWKILFSTRNSLSMKESVNSVYSLDTLPQNEIQEMKYVNDALHFITPSGVFKLVGNEIVKVNESNGATSAGMTLDIYGDQTLMVDSTGSLKINGEQAVVYENEEIRRMDINCGCFVHPDAIAYPATYGSSSGFSMYNGQCFTHDQHKNIKFLASDGQGCLLVIDDAGVVQLYQISSSDLSPQHSQVPDGVIPIGSNFDMNYSVAFDHNHIYVLNFPGSK